MPTVRAMANMNFMMYKMSMGGSIGSAASYLGASSTLSGYSSSSYGTMDAALAKEYAATKDKFDEEFGSAMNALKSSSDALKKMKFDVGGESAVTTTTNEDGSTTVTKSDRLKDALKTIENFVSDYNNAIDFFKENAGGSSRMTSLAREFADNTYLSSSYKDIGIVVDSDGKMKIDEDVLTKSLTDDPSRVEKLLGKGGLASKADMHVAIAEGQKDSLFSSVISSKLGGTSLSSLLSSASTGGYSYSANAISRMARYSMVGNLLNMFV